MTTRRVTCSDCNTKFGVGIDAHLAGSFRDVRNIFQIRKGDGAAAPSLVRELSNNETVILGGDGSSRMRIKRQMSFPTGPDGGKGFRGSFTSLSNLLEQIPNIAGALRLTEGETVTKLEEAEATLTETSVPEISSSLEVGGVEDIRAATKACLVLWALKVGNQEIQYDQYNASRQFVKNGGAEFQNMKTAIDTRRCCIASKIEQHYGPLFNLIYIRSNAEGRVVGHFTLFNLFSYQIVLAESGGTPDQAIALVSNPLKNSEWSKHFAKDFNLSFEWIDTPAFDQSEFTARCRALELVYGSIGKDIRLSEMHRIIDEVFDEYETPNANLSSEELVSEFLRKVFERIKAYLQREPFEKKISLRNLQSNLQKPEYG